MTIITYNVNGIRAAITKGILEWLRTVNPDVVCFQEIKAQTDQIPVERFEELGYHTYWHPAQKKGYSGVGILSKQKPNKVVYGMGIEAYDNEGRVLRADFDNMSIISTYHPSGTTGEERQDFKMKWLDDFFMYANTLKTTIPNLVIAGDYNICHQAIDIHDPIRNATSSGFLPEEREWLTKFLASGFIDTFRHFVKDTHHYTWWSYRAGARHKNLGWRIDYLMATTTLVPFLKRAVILPEAKHSDHCPALLEIGEISVKA